MTTPKIDPTNELGATLAAYEFALTALVTTSAQCRTLFDELFGGQVQLVNLMQRILEREQELARQEGLPPIYQ